MNVRHRRPLGAAASTRLLAGLALTLTGSVAGAGEGTESTLDLRRTLPPWTAIPLEPSARSVRVLLGEQSILTGPSSGAPRRGTAAEGARLPVFGVEPGPGCRSPWLHVGASAWLCGDQAEMSTAAALPPADGHVLAGDDGLPFRYHFAGPGGARGYRALEDFDVTEPAFEFDPGFAIAVVEERSFAGERYARTRRGLWIRLAEFTPARPSEFRGAELDVEAGQAVPVAWVTAERAPVFRRAGKAFAATADSLPRLERVGWYEEVRGVAGSYARIDDARWVRASDLRHPGTVPPPDEPDVARGARWIDVELASQTLVAYDGPKAVFATLVSTGRGKPGTALATPTGVHRIWVKLLGTTMDNLEQEDAARYYRIEDVPYVQFFSKGVGLHAAFWHRSFGRVRSHGCVNLAPLDAARLFAFTAPGVPAGWTAALPFRFDGGTVVRVR